MLSLQVAAPASKNSPGPGALLHERYWLVREIGQGGFGVVYLAEDCSRENQDVAVKQINIGQLSTRKAIDATDSYNREVRLLSQLKHRHLPRIYDHFTDPEHWYLVMDYIDGQTLEEYLQASQGKALPIKKVIDIGLQLCDVLGYLHNQNPPIIFRDVKPGNIMLTKRGQIYLIDFGIARYFASERRKDTGALGSPGYAAPEQYGKAQTTVQTDIYGLGATLQTLATGKEPLELQMEEAPSIPRQHKKLHNLLDEMLEQESSQRPRNMQEVKSRLENSLRGRKEIVRSYLWGFLLGIGPYALFEILGYVSPLSIPLLTQLCEIVLITVYCFWPFLICGQLITALFTFLQPRQRFFSLGILSGLLLFALVLFLQHGPLAYFLSWPSLGD